MIKILLLLFLCLFKCSVTLRTSTVYGTLQLFDLTAALGTVGTPKSRTQPRRQKSSPEGQNSRQEAPGSKNPAQEGPGR